MISIQKQVSEVMQNNENITLPELKKRFGDVNPNTIRSAFNRAKASAIGDANDASNATINMEMVEGLLMKQLKKKPDVSVLRLMVDFLKIKSQDHSEMEEIDLSIFMKKAMDD